MMESKSKGGAEKLRLQETASCSGRCFKYVHMDIFSAAPGVGRPSRSFIPVAAIGPADDDGGGCGGDEVMLNQEGDDTGSERELNLW